MRSESRSFPILVLLVAILVLVALLAAQAFAAATSQRAMAEKVLRDYAAQAADEYARRATNEIGFNGYYFVITALKDAVTSPSTMLPAPGDLAGHVPEEGRGALALAKTVFRFDPAAGRLDSAGSPLDADAAAWLRRALGEKALLRLRQGRRYETRYVRIGGTLHGFVFVPVAAAPSGPTMLLGFGVDTVSLRSALRRAVERGPLLPPSLGGGRIAKDAVSLSVTDPFGGDMLAVGEGHSPLLAAEKRLGPDPNGILQDFVVRTAIDPSAAALLVIGGLPRSRLPVLLALLILTAGLMLTAMVQLRREHALGRLRSDFVSRVSHELRTPLTQIRMFSETLLLDRVRGEDERIRAIEIIDREARRLSHLVDNVLRFSRAQRERDRLAPRARELGSIVGDLVEEFRPMAAGRGASLQARVQDQAFASVDDDALRQILLNLLDNAVKYGPQGQEILVGVSNGSAGARIWVDDEGPGVREKERERIWQPFYRAKAHRESAVAGTGIGLSVVADLVSLHGGRFWVEPGERNGARFVVEFPAAEPPEETS